MLSKHLKEDGMVLERAPLTDRIPFLKVLASPQEGHVCKSWEIWGRNTGKDIRETDGAGG